MADLSLSAPPASSALSSRDAPVVAASPSVKRVPSEALLSAEGSWHIEEQDAEAYDPAKAHMLARQKVDPSRRKKNAALVPGFEPGADDSDGGRFRILKLEPPGGTDEPALVDYAAMEGGVTEKAIVKPAHKVVGSEILEKFKTLFAEDEKEEARTALAPGRQRPDGGISYASVTAAAALKKKPLPVERAAGLSPSGQGRIEAVRDVETSGTKQSFSFSGFLGALISDEPEAVSGSAPSRKSQAGVSVQSPPRQTVNTDGPPSVNGIRNAEHEGKTRLVLDISEPVNFTATIERVRNVLQIRLPGAGWDAPSTGKFQNGGLLGSYVTRPMQGGGTLLEIRLKKSSGIVRVMSLKENVVSGPRIVVDLRN